MMSQEWRGFGALPQMMRVGRRQVSGGARLQDVVVITPGVTRAVTVPPMLR